MAMNSMVIPHLINKQKKTIPLLIGFMLRSKMTYSATAILKYSGHGNDNPNECVRSLCDEGKLKEALNSLYSSDKPIHNSTYLCLLQSCSKKKALPEGKSVHIHMKSSGFMPEIVLLNSLINMYGKCGSVGDARQVFDEMHDHNVISWTAIISAYVRSGFPEEAVGLFQQMQKTGIQSNHFTVATILRAIAKMEDLDMGAEIHGQIFIKGFQFDVIVGNALVDMYAKCGRLEAARNVFDKMFERDVVSWTTMIAGFEQNGLYYEALEVFYRMQEVGVMPNLKTFTSAISACGHLGALEQGMEIHSQFSSSGVSSDSLVENALLDMYSKCGKINKARELFDKLPQRSGSFWTTMIAGYMGNGLVHEALDVFVNMKDKSTAAWTAIIAGYAQNGYSKEALELYQKMKLLTVSPDLKTFVSVLPACGKLGALEQGKEIHGEIIRRKLQSHVIVSNALVDMYAKCGSIEEARYVFNKVEHPDVFSWSSMIGGYGMHGCPKEALNLFEQMQQSGTKPNLVTFVCVLSACCHAGLVDKGMEYFNRMSRYYHLTPAMEHYSCMVDLLGRAGKLDEAEEFINKMPTKPDASVFSSLLAACRVHKNVELGERMAGFLFELNPQSDFPYVLLSNIYASVGNWEGIVKVRTMMKDRKVIKIPGCSWIEVNRKVHTFLVGDKSHPQTEEIYEILNRLSMQIKAAGYVPDLSFVLNDVEKEQKEQILSQHSEKLAIAFGFINTFPGTVIRVTKNLRICGDCHTAAKYISNIICREIIVRDINRYHHFKDGQCSCADYW